MFCALVACCRFITRCAIARCRGTLDRVLSPVFFVAGCLLHEQETVILFFFSAAALVYLLREKRARVVHVVLTILALAALIFMLTAPGAYFRMNWENQTLSGFALYCSNLTLYFYRLTTDNWVYLTAFGLLALWALHRCKEPAGGTRIFSWILKAILAFGSLYGPAAQALHLPEVVQINPEEAAPREFGRPRSSACSGFCFCFPGFSRCFWPRAAKRGGRCAFLRRWPWGFGRPRASRRSQRRLPAAQRCRWRFSSCCFCCARCGR